MPRQAKTASNQALEFNEALGLDGIIMTKLDGTAGRYRMAVAEKLKLPILRIAWASRSMTCRSSMPKISAAPPWWRVQLRSD